MTYIVLLFAANLLLNPAFAQDQKGPVASSCSDEIKKYCSNIAHGTGQVRACLESHKSELSTGCQNALNTTGGGWYRNQQKQ